MSTRRAKVALYELSQPLVGTLTSVLVSALGHKILIQNLEGTHEVSRRFTVERRPSFTNKIVLKEDAHEKKKAAHTKQAAHITYEYKDYIGPVSAKR